MHKRPFTCNKGNRPDSNIRSICIVLAGSADVINKVDDFHVVTLAHGQHFGSSDLLRIPDIEYYGDIHAGKKGLKLLVVSKPDQVIQLYERRNLQEHVAGLLNPLRLMVESRYRLGRGVMQEY